VVAEARRGAGAAAAVAAGSAEARRAPRRRAARRLRAAFAFRVAADRARRLCAAFAFRVAADCTRIGAVEIERVATAAPDPACRASAGRVAAPEGPVADACLRWPGVDALFVRPRADALFARGGADARFARPGADALFVRPGADARFAAPRVEARSLGAGAAGTVAACIACPGGPWRGGPCAATDEHNAASNADEAAVATIRRSRPVDGRLFTDLRVPTFPPELSSSWARILDPGEGPQGSFPAICGERVRGPSGSRC
jgi:hypothetical protein